MSTASSARQLPTWMENGDHLTAEEFLHAWEHMPEVKRAELLDGKVYMGPAAVNYNHARPHAVLSTIVGYYESSTPGVEALTTPSLKLDPKNVPEPDVLVRLKDGLGTSAISEKILSGPVELAIEISNTSSSKDIYEKREIYERLGIQEYLIWRTAAGEFDHFVRKELSGGGFERTIYREGVIKSVVFPGLWLDATAMLAYEMRAALETLQQGLKTAEHARFVEQLRAKMG